MPTTLDRRYISDSLPAGFTQSGQFAPRSPPSPRRGSAWKTKLGEEGGQFARFGRCAEDRLPDATARSRSRYPQRSAATAADRSQTHAARLASLGETEAPARSRARSRRRRVRRDRATRVEGVSDQQPVAGHEGSLADRQLDRIADPPPPLTLEQMEVIAAPTAARVAAASCRPARSGVAAKRG